jgi:hypothetical protein
MELPTCIQDLIFEYKHQFELGVHIERMKHVNNQFKAHQSCMGGLRGMSAFAFNWKFSSLGNKVVRHIISDIERHTILWPMVEQKWYKF